MTPLIGAAFGMLIGLGVLLVIQGARGNSVLPTLDQIAPGVRPEVVLLWFSGGLMAGLVLYAVTGWIVLALVGGGFTMFSHRFLGGSKDKREFIERTQAIATWTELIRDNISGAAGLEQSLRTSAEYAPAPIAAEIKRFTQRVDRMSLIDALRMLGDDLDHPSADLVIVSLSNAARMEARDLGPLLSRVAESIRGEVRMRMRVEVGRARIRTSARIVTLVTLLTVLLVYTQSNDLLRVYDTAAGQVWMSFVIAIFVAGFWLMKKFGELDMPERFSARRNPSAADAVSQLSEPVQ